MSKVSGSEGKEGSAAFTSFADYIQTHGAAIADAPALLQKGEEPVSWAALAAKAARIANRLLSLGCSAGDTVAYLGRNSIAQAEMMAGITSAGCVLVPLPTSATAEVLGAMLWDCGAKVLALDLEFVEALKPEVEICSSMLDGGLVGLDFGDADFATLDEWCAAESGTPPPVEIKPSDLFAITYSSGTTGTPKGIMLDHGTRMGQAELMALAEFGPGAVNIISTPLYSYGAISTWMPSIVAGGANLLMPRFDAREFLALVEEFKGTHAILVPVQYERILKLDDFGRFDISSMKYWFGGSAPMHERVKREMVERLPGELLEMYSLTEGGVTTVLMLKHFPDKLGSVGRPANGCDLRIIDDDDHELPVGEVGEIVGRSPLKMSGYLNKPEMSAEMIWRDSEGLAFIRSGDNGRVDEDGFLYLLDRKKDMIISGGFNIYASDLEAVVMGHGAVEAVSVIGAPSESWGETPFAFAVLKDEDAAEVDALLAWANERLGKTQRLSGLRLVEALPVNHLGKVQKTVLREWLKEG